MENIKVCHLTSVHPRYDVRIFEKECKSLLNEGYIVSLIVADGLGDEIKDGINIYDVGKMKGRFNRFFRTTNRVLKKAIKLDAEVYHLHDPELVPVGLKIKKNKKNIVIYDAHEDLPLQILTKPYLNAFSAKILSQFILIYEKYALKKLDFIIGATETIREKYKKYNKNITDINNFPIIGELSNDTSWDKKKDEVTYVGGISKIRGIEEIIDSLELIGSNEAVKLNLAGLFNEASLEQEMKNKKGWIKVNDYGFVDRQKVAEILSKSKAGLVTLYPTLNYLDSMPVKMFEYMMAGIPVISSNIPLWESIINKYECGICVDPKKPKEIAEAILKIMHNPEDSKKMGLNGKKIIKEKYNWSIEEKKLIEVYSSLL